MRALITGINGFTGQYLRRSLVQSGFDVMGLESNLLDGAGVVRELREKKPSHIFHLAACSFVADNKPNKFYEVNVIGTRNLLEAIHSSVPNIEGVLLSSTANVYGNESEGIICESALPNPTNDYSVSKLAMEYMASLWNTKLPIIITRPFNYTGVGQNSKFLIPKIVNHFKFQEDIIELGNIDVYREFGDVRDIVLFYKNLMLGKHFGLTVNVCNGLQYSLSSVIEMCSNLTGHRINVVVNQKFVRENEVKTLVGSPSLLTSKINAKNKYELRDTLSWMLNN